MRRPPPPAVSCFDGVQNQEELGVDCGGVCLPCAGLPEQIRFDRASYVSGERGAVDALFYLENVNPQWGARAIPYTLFLDDAQGQVIAQRQGTTFLLPLERHPVIEQGIAVGDGEVIADTRVEIGETTWVEVAEYGIRDDELVVLVPTFTQLTSGPDFAEVRGIVRNDAPFSFDRVEIYVVVSNRGGEVLGARATDMRTLRSGELREFRIAWRTPFPLTGGEPQLEIVAITNIFEDDNFIRETGMLEPFQEFE